MRANTLLGTWTVVAGLSGICSAAEPAQSISSVGFIKLTIPVGFSLIANPLDAGDNSIGAILPDMPEGAVIYRFGGSPPKFSINTYEGGWTQPNETLKPGEGAFFLNPGPGRLTITFYGEVLQGTLTNAIPQGLSLKSSVVPVAGPLDLTLNFPVAEGDTVYRFRRALNPDSYGVYAYGLGEWNARPYIEIGEAFFVMKVAPAEWVKTFSLNP